MEDPMMVSRPNIIPDATDADQDKHIRNSSKVIIKPLTDQDDVDESAKLTDRVDTGQPESAPILGETGDQGDEPEDSDVADDFDHAQAAKPDEISSKLAKPEAVEEADSSIEVETEPTKSKSSESHESEAKKTENTEDAGSETAALQTKSDKEAALLEADAKAQDELDTLVGQKTYFLPINAVEQRRSRHVLIFGIILILILAVAWLNIALDAGFVDIPGVRPLTHLFSN
jgi:hypothetical protein